MHRPVHFSRSFFFTLLLCASTLIAGTTGKIAGRLTDEKSGEPIIGATVLMVGTSMGASSELDGSYMIGSVSPGT